MGVSRGATTVRSALRRAQITDPAVAGTTEALDTLAVTEVPATLLIDSSGRVLSRQVSFGVADERWFREWKSVVDEELAGLRR